VIPPPLPPRLTQVRTVTAVGSLLWLLGAVFLLVAALAGWRPLDIWFTTCLAGMLLGGIGWGIYTWQRAAARRGSRTAQRGLD
jgi:protein-S-isoprenylcysteine O-methyltransferase Ste14